MSRNPDDIIAKALKALKQAPLYRKNEDGSPPLTILGGQVRSDCFDEFLAMWRKRWESMPYRIWEQISQIEFADEPQAFKYLQRAELFGEGGHLSLRRDGKRWFWHYIGPAKEPASKGLEAEYENFWKIKGNSNEDFWQLKENSTVPFRRYEEHVLLWGEDKKNQGFWWDDRVAAAKLKYPIDKGGRVCLKFWRFTENGRSAFVWYRGLEKMTTGAKKRAL